MSIGLKQAAQHALLALEKSQPHPSNPVIGLTKQDFIDHEETIRQLRAAIQQAQQPVTGEPVAWIRRHLKGALSNGLLIHAQVEQVRRDSGAWVPLYTHPAPSVPATIEPVVDVRCEGCGYMTHHREHMGCVRAAKQHTHPAPSVTEPVAWLDEMLADTREVFDVEDWETPKVVRDVIEYVKSWVTVYSEKNHPTPAAHPAPSVPDVPDDVVRDAERYRFIRDADVSDDLIPDIALYAMESLDEYIDTAMLAAK